jgi:hypothetical protein
LVLFFVDNAGDVRDLFSHRQLGTIEQIADHWVGSAVISALKTVSPRGVAHRGAVNKEGNNAPRDIL